MSGNDLLERIEKIERFLASLGPLVNVSERLAQCERLLMFQGMDIEKNSANIETCLKNLTVLNEITQPPADNATLSERLTQCEAVLMQHGLDIEKNSANVEELVEEHKLQGTINASLQGQVSGLNERLAGGVSAREDATVALYGGEQ